MTTKYMKFEDIPKGKAPLNAASVPYGLYELDDDDGRYYGLSDRQIKKAEQSA